jgi:hypothetical protein
MIAVGAQQSVAVLWPALALQMRKQFRPGLVLPSMRSAVVVNVIEL